jgi:hypothetical protein
LYRTIWLLLDSISIAALAFSDGPNWVGLPFPIHLKTETDPVSETLWSFLKLPHTRRWTESKRSQIVLYNIHHRQNTFKSTSTLVVYLTTPSVSQFIHLQYLCVIWFLRWCESCHIFLHSSRNTYLREICVNGTLLSYLILLYKLLLQWCSRLV